MRRGSCFSFGNVNLINAISNFRFHAHTSGGAFRSFAQANRFADRFGATDIRAKFAAQDVAHKCSQGRRS